MFRRSDIASVDPAASANPMSCLVPTRIQEVYTMISIEKIQSFSQQIAEKFQPERIILFGSYAHGNPSEDSDVDLLVILPFEEMPVQKAISIRQQIKAPFPLDLMARTPQQIQNRLEMGDLFIQDIISKGRVLYAANHAEANHPRMDQ